MDALVMSMESVDESEDLEATERDLENRGREMLRAALQRKAQREADATPPGCPKCGAALKAPVRRETQILSRFGPIRISRDYGYCPKCKQWRALPAHFGNWHTIYVRTNRWAKHGVLSRVFEEIQSQGIVRIRIEAVAINSTCAGARPDATGALKKKGPQAIGQTRGGRNTKIHMVAADSRTALTFSLSPGRASDDLEGRKLLRAWASRRPPGARHMLMDRAYEGDAMRRLVVDSGMEPVVPPKKNRLKP